jgi:hypothetical protein
MQMPGWIMCMVGWSALRLTAMPNVVQHTAGAAAASASTPTLLSGADTAVFLCVCRHL